MKISDELYYAALKTMPTDTALVVDASAVAPHSAVCNVKGRGESTGRRTEAMRTRLLAAGFHVGPTTTDRHGLDLAYFTVTNFSCPAAETVAFARRVAREVGLKPLELDASDSRAAAAESTRGESG